MLEGIIGAVIGAFATGFVTLILDKRKEKREDKKEWEKVQKDVFEERPELAIIEFKDYILRSGYGIKQKCDIDLFVAHIKGIELDGGVSALYHEEDLNQNEWCCVIYTFKNVGKTDISVLNIISTYKKDTCIFSSLFVKEYMSEGLINYSNCYDRKIRVGDVVTLKLCYHKERILCGVATANIVVGLQDSNGHYWQQPLFAPRNKLYDSFMVKRTEYLRDLRNDDAIECFQKPYLW